MTLHNKSNLQDSGERTTFDTGAIREIVTGKGRFDLIPFESIAPIVDDDVIKNIAYYQQTDNYKYLEDALKYALVKEYNKTDGAVNNEYEFLMKLAIHFEQGALKYKEDNWKMGLPIKSYIDSACRHYCKHNLFWNDEPHFIAFAWNIICAIWTIQHLD